MVERISLMLRLDWRPERLERELQKLVNRMYKTELPLDPTASDLIVRRAMSGETADRLALLNSVERLFQV